MLHHQEKKCFVCNGNPLEFWWIPFFSQVVNYKRIIYLLFPHKKIWWLVFSLQLLTQKIHISKKLSFFLFFFASQESWLLMRNPQGILKFKDWDKLRRGKLRWASGFHNLFFTPFNPNKTVSDQDCQGFQLNGSIIQNFSRP